MQGHGQEQAPRAMRIKAWAKVNLALNIVGRRPDRIPRPRNRHAGIVLPNIMRYYGGNIGRAGGRPRQYVCRPVITVTVTGDMTWMSPVCRVVGAALHSAARALQVPGASQSPSIIYSAFRWAQGLRRSADAAAVLVV